MLIRRAADYVVGAGLPFFNSMAAGEEKPNLGTRVSRVEYIPFASDPNDPSGFYFLV